jgi:hypothetical protein
MNPTTRNHRRVASATCTIVALTIGLLLACVSPATAQPPPPPPTLTGEVLVENHLPTPTSDPQCTQSGGTTSFTFDVGPGEGQTPLNAPGATQPYPGTFTEHVTVTIGPPTITPAPPFPFNGGVEQNFSAGALIAVQADFTINVLDGTVITGTKTLSGTLPSLPSAGVCSDFNTGQVQGYYKDVRAYGLLYEALIQTDHGTFVDEGTSNLFARQGQSTPNVFQFDFLGEAFTSDLNQTVPLQPGLGCGDVNHEHERRGECPNNVGS